MNQPLVKLHRAPRLVLITPEGIAVYEGRKPLASTRTEYKWTATDIEEVRTQEFVKEAK